MLTVVALRHTKVEGHGEKIQDLSIETNNDFLDFSDENLLGSIDFDDIFLDMDHYGNDLPDFEMDSVLLADFSISTDDEESDPNIWVPVGLVEDRMDKSKGEDEENSFTERDKNVGSKLSSRDGHVKGRSKLSSQGKNSHAKRKVKVDWTPELHKRFVQAVEQLGADKAVPSRILEIMGIDCLTRHNIASHLQKYRSHRKHLLAREAEAASWSQRRQMYGSTSTASGGVGTRELNPWHAPTLGFLPRPAMPPAQPPVHTHHFRPLHVWGHPSLDQSSVRIWPSKHLAYSLSPPPQGQPSWATRTPAIDPSYWHPHNQRSKESIDAAIEDVISKPWLPLPLGLKPPSLDGGVGGASSPRRSQNTTISFLFLKPYKS